MAEIDFQALARELMPREEFSLGKHKFVAVGIAVAEIEDLQRPFLKKNGKPGELDDGDGFMKALVRRCLRTPGGGPVLGPTDDLNALPVVARDQVLKAVMRANGMNPEDKDKAGNA